MKKIELISCILAAILFFTSATAQNVLMVRVNEPKADVQPTMWGIFFEDINLGADGGLYAELVKNGSFEFPQPKMGWQEEGGVAAIATNEPAIALNPHFLVLRTDINGA